MNHVLESPGTRRALAAVVALALGLSLAACATDPSAPAKPDTPAKAASLTTVRVGVVPTVNTAMPNIAIDEKLGEAHGLNLERTTIAGAGSTNQVAALLSGDLDVAVGGTNTVIDAVAQDADLQIIGSVAPLLFSIVMNKGVADGLDVDPDADIDDRIRALKGLKVAVSPPGSTGNTVLRAMLEDVGLNPDADVSFVPMTDVGAVPAGLTRGTFDASFVAVGAGEVAIASGDAILWASIPRGDIDVFNNYMGVIAFATRSYIDENPDVVKAVHASLVDAQELTTEKPDEVAGILKASIFAELDQDVFDEAWSQVKGAYPAGMNFTAKHWDTFKSLFDASSENDYEAIEYENLVADFARGK